jgi:hypothetical protein
MERLDFGRVVVRRSKIKAYKTDGHSDNPMAGTVKCEPRCHLGWALEFLLREAGEEQVQDYVHFFVLQPTTVLRM